MEAEGPGTVNEVPSQPRAGPFPPGCLVFVRNVHPDTNKTTLKSLFSVHAFFVDVDFMITAHRAVPLPLRTARSSLRSRLGQSSSFNASEGMHFHLALRL